MTSNAGSHLNQNSIGFENQNQKRNKSKIEDALKETFRPEFLNRIDEIIIFDALSEEQLLKIVDLMLQETQKALKDKNISLNIDDSAKKFILQNGTDLKYGARPLRRAIQRLIEDEIAERLLKGEFTNGQTINVSLLDEKLQFTAGIKIAKN